MIIDTNLKPTLENVISALKTDAIGRNANVFKFVDFLSLLDKGISISLDAPWGEGKTFFIKQCKAVIDSFNEDNKTTEDDDKKTITELYEKNKKLSFPNQLLCVYYDAWMKDNNIDPLSSLIAEIVTQTSSEYSFKNNEKITNYAKEVIKTFGKLLYNIDLPLSTSSSTFKEYDYIDSAIELNKIHERITEFFTELLSEKHEKLVIFIDELDRCRPNYAVELLERVKHYFDDERLIFVFATNTEQLQHTIKKYYGNDFDGYNYLDRFFDIKLSIPNANYEKFDRSLNVVNMNVFFRVCRELADHYGLSLRERSKYFNMAKIAGYHVTNNKYGFYNSSYQNAIDFSILYIVPLLLIEKMKDIKSYNSFIRGNNKEKLHKLVEIFDNESNFEHFLFDNDDKKATDTNEKNNINKEKLSQAYDCLFNIDLNEEVRIGSCEFSRQIGNHIIEISNIMSDYTPYDDEKGEN